MVIFDITGKLSDVTGSYDAAFLFSGCLVLLATGTMQIVNLYKYCKHRKLKLQQSHDETLE